MPGPHMSQGNKVLTNRLRRQADRQGLRLVKSRSRDPHTLDYGRFSLISAQAAGDPAIAGRWMTLAEVDAYLNRPAAHD